jgi:methyltransferase family protein
MSSEEYCRTGHRRVQGWLSPDAPWLVADLANSQDIRGHVGEIGVYHGKLFILLALLRRSGEHAVAVDLFDENGPRGNRRMFHNNLESFNLTTDITVKEIDSTTVTSQSLLEWSGGDGKGFRLFSVDGGHSADITESDLRCASGALEAGGLLILDDYYNETWPGVAEGTNRFLTANPGMIPIGTAFGKMLFTNAVDQAAVYRAQMSRVAATRGWRVHERVFYGHPHAVLQSQAQGLAAKSVGQVGLAGRSAAESLLRSARSAQTASSKAIGKAIRGNPTVTLSPTCGNPGAAITVSGTGFSPREPIEVKYRTGLWAPDPASVVIFRATAAADGSFTCSGHIPSGTTAGEKGVHTIKARGARSGLKATTSLSLS